MVNKKAANRKQQLTLPAERARVLSQFPVKRNTAIDVRAYIDIVKTLLRRRFALDFLRAGWYPIIENV